MGRRSLGDSRRAVIWLRRIFPVFERLGLHLTFNHFYEPIPDVRSLPDEVFQRESELPGVEMRETEQLALLERIGGLRHEYEGFAAEPDPASPHGYHRRNLMFERVDAEVLHALVRLRKPRRVIEIGSGYSTLVTAAAIALNEQEDPGYACELTCVDPYPRDFLRDLPRLTRLVEAPVQEVPLELFGELEAGDFLFIDSSHVVKIASDAQLELLELVPRVPNGVLVHFHDIFFPTDYPEGFVREWHLFWNEQYVLQAFLAFNAEFAVRWSSSYLARRHEARVREAFPSFARGGMWPSSLWIERL